MFNKITKIDILAFIAGLISGPVAYYSVEGGFLDFLKFNIIFIPGFIFGFFSAPFMLHYVKSYLKVFIWIIVSVVSYFVAYWAGLLSGIAGGGLVKNIISYTVGGFVGSSVLILGYCLITKHKMYKHFIKIITVGTLLPGTLLLFFGVRADFVAGPVPNDPYVLVMMTLWQGFMLFAFVHLFRKASEETTELQNQDLTNKQDQNYEQ